MNYCEPQSELARYAFGYSDKKPGWSFWAIHAGMAIYTIWAIFFSAPAAAHCYSRWYYPSDWPVDRCGHRHSGSTYWEARLQSHPEKIDPPPEIEPIIIPPGWDEEQERIERLRQQPPAHETTGGPIAGPPTSTDPKLTEAVEALKALLATKKPTNGREGK